MFPYVIYLYSEVVSLPYIDVSPGNSCFHPCFYSSEIPGYTFASAGLQNRYPDLAAPAVLLVLLDGQGGDESVLRAAKATYRPGEARKGGLEKTEENREY